MRLLDSPNRNAVYWSALPLIAAVYIKYNAIFIGPLLLGVLLWKRGFEELRRPTPWIWGIVGVALLAPAAALMSAWGRFNVTQAIDVGPGQGAALELHTLRNWTYYLEQLPLQAGWETVALAAAELGGLRAAASVARPRPPRGRARGLVRIRLPVFSLIALKEQRHADAAAAGAAGRDPVPAGGAARPGRCPSCLARGPCCASGAAVIHPLPTVTGYALAADQLAQLAKPNSVVMFFGTGAGTETLHSGCAAVTTSAA